MKLILNDKTNKPAPNIENFSKEIAEEVRAFHKTFPEYNVTPLVKLSDLAKKLGVKDIYVKDESKRFNLNAFKVLGGSYAIGKEMESFLNLGKDELSFEALTNKKAAEKIKKLTFVSATDGNHGRGVAWTAKRLGAHAVIYMPKGSAKERYDNIIATGSECYITDQNYDDSVRLATKTANEKENCILVQDTAFGDYIDIPLHIMQGYMTMALEAYESLGGAIPTHIFIQAGVGSLAGAITGFFANVYKNNKPVIVTVEPNNAACIYKSGEKNDGKPHFVKGALKTIMAGLSCGEPCSIAYEVLNYYADAYLKMGDGVAKKAMRLLAYPVGNDEKIVSGESGCAGFGAAVEIIKNYPELKKKLGIDKNSVMLFFSTEGDTDKENYQKIVAKKGK